MKTSLLKKVVISLLIITNPIILFSQKDKIKVSAKGTGRTTGHIATLNINNSGEKPLKIKAQTMYIPSDGKYQSYVGNIPEGIVIAAGESLPVPVMGYCTDVHKPPVGADDSMPALSSWIPVQVTDNNWLNIENQISILPMAEVPPYSISDIPNLSIGDGFIENPSLEGAPVITTWSGSDIPIYGSIQMQGNEIKYAPLIVDALGRIEKASFELIDKDLIHTPFSANEMLEKEAIIQQTFWVYLGLITGEGYDKEDFENQLIAQYENKSNSKIEDASDETVAKLESGVDDFWSAFELVGVEAKVISVQSGLASGVKDGMEKAFGGADNSAAKAVSDGSKAAAGLGAGAIAKGDKVAIGSGSGGDSTIGNEGAHVAQGAAATGSSGAVGEGSTSGQGAAAASGGNGTAEAADPIGKKKEGKYDEITNKEDFKGQMRQYYENYELARRQGASHDAACKKLGIKPDSDEAKALEKVFKTEMHIN